MNLWLLQGLDPELEVWLSQKADCGVLWEGPGLGCPRQICPVHQTGGCKSFLAQFWGWAVTGDWELLVGMNFPQLAKAAQPCWLLSHSNVVALIWA